MSKVFESRFDIDKGKAVRIAAELFDQFYGGKGFFRDYRMPEYIPPRNLTTGSSMLSF